MESTTFEALISEYGNSDNFYSQSYSFLLYDNSTSESDFVTLNTSTSFPSVVIPSQNVNKTLTVRSSGVFESKLIVPLYVVIFLFAVIGNSLVVITLARNKRMRTVTNVFLLNLAISDLLLGVFCMPFTLVGQILRNFIFGAMMCKLIPYIQAVSVSVGVWTLVAISLERYFAICRPLKSRRWQTQFHAYKMIAIVWVASLLWTSPILAVSKLKAMRSKGHKCREEWPGRISEQAFNLILDGTLLLMPLLLMTLAYSLIVKKLWKGLQIEIQHNSSCQRQVARSHSTPAANGLVVNNVEDNSPENSFSTSQSTTQPHHANRRHNGQGSPSKMNPRPKKKLSKIWLLRGMNKVSTPASGKGHTTGLSHAVEEKSVAEEPMETTYTFSRLAIRSNYMEKSIEAKKNVIKMLFVIIAEFFICWAPLHALNTVYLFSPELVYKYVGSTGVALVQLLAYVSSCCNPITYCFMNKKFRQAFVAIFDCNKCVRSCCPFLFTKIPNDNTNRVSVGLGKNTPQNPSDASCNDSVVYVGRTNRSGMVTSEAEDRV